MGFQFFIWGNYSYIRDGSIVGICVDRSPYFELILFNLVLIAARSRFAEATFMDD